MAVIDKVYQTLERDILLDILHNMTQSAKHMRRLQMVYVKCHDNCLCNGVCENPDALTAASLTDKMIKNSNTLSNILNGVKNE